MTTELITMQEVKCTNLVTYVLKDLRLGSYNHKLRKPVITILI